MRKKLAVEFLEQSSNTLIKQKLVPVELEDFHPRSGRGERADRGERSDRADRQSDRQGDRYESHVPTMLKHQES